MARNCRSFRSGDATPVLTAILLSEVSRQLLQFGPPGGSLQRFFSQGLSSTPVDIVYRKFASSLARFMSYCSYTPGRSVSRMRTAFDEKGGEGSRPGFRRAQAVTAKISPPRRRAFGFSPMRAQLALRPAGLVIGGVRVERTTTNRLSGPARRDCVEHHRPAHRPARFAR